MCKLCAFCTTGSGIEFEPFVGMSANADRIQRIMHACPTRDPRLLTCFALGILSPRLLSIEPELAYGHQLFGSMNTVFYSTLLEAFKKKCGGGHK